MNNSSHHLKGKIKTHRISWSCGTRFLTTSQFSKLNKDITKITKIDKEIKFKGAVYKWLHKI